MSHTKTLILATHNRHKVEELSAALGKLRIDIRTLDAFPQVGEIEETGKTLLENALLKARTVHQLTGLPAIADDTGLEVDALDGAPGVYSARYAGENVSYADNVNKMLFELKDIEDQNRGAKFRTVIAFVSSKKELWAEGFIQGFISQSPTGKRGFGYDPIFYVPELKKTFAELTGEEKNEISHRGLALKKIVKKLKNEFQPKGKESE
ncbi:MAG: XTP/dITP diphosphatase [Candidatus Marinimicrobia bacterium]|nr:XTP/dITP diphosphatase [Candidatus Neomarinimicrobiota bacterium]MBT4178432.1 XTP/dITP diphosphatase [Candidatus Neomarinimicrobiota bacterium]MBT5404804.1 XTP/dITP diphosphatase [Candidatus Neomarinimicrobiota bacterium]MBT6159213.1 XTP/dITP diphosphatase [Candidatus Neomarinimicrobiota bacterium]MBT6914451.1 XTP/dITP diphosphatase [Candidatus Neomarinimicrobiota bacterium]